MLMTHSCHSSIRVLKKNIQHYSIHHKNMQLRSTGRTVSLISSREGISEQGNRKHGPRLALNSHTWSWRGKILLSGRLFLLISFRCWLARLPLVLSSLLGGTLQFFDFLSYLQLCHFWLTLPKPRVFSSWSCRSITYAYQETSLELGWS